LDNERDIDCETTSELVSGIQGQTVLSKGPSMVLRVMRCTIHVLSAPEAILLLYTTKSTKTFLTLNTI
jgi:hypothetical protein